MEALPDRHTPTRAGEDATLAPTGELDATGLDWLERRVYELYGQGAERVIVDLRGVGFMDSTGLRGLISVRNHAKRTRHGLALIAGPPAVQRLFALTATRGLFDWFEDD